MRRALFHSLFQFTLSFTTPPPPPPHDLNGSILSSVIENVAHLKDDCVSVRRQIKQRKDERRTRRRTAAAVNDAHKRTLNSINVPKLTEKMAQNQGNEVRR